MKNDHRQEQKLFYICSPPPNFNVELGWVPNQVVMKNDHLRWTPFCFTSNFEIGGAGVVTSSHASNPRWSFFMTNPGKENCQTNKNPGLKPLIIAQHALRIPLQLGSLSCSFLSRWSMHIAETIWFTTKSHCSSLSHEQRCRKDDTTHTKMHCNNHSHPSNETIFKGLGP